jgi:diketogulonate reductase-like aldo/keto reductase
MLKIPTKKLRNGFEMPVYSLGIWQMGGRWEADTTKDTQEVEAIRYALSKGVTSIDTAEGYGNGHAEELLREALIGYDRSKIFISTKVSGNHQSYQGVHDAFNASCRRLGVDYVDLYILHRYPEPGMPIQETMRAIDELVASGKIHYVGVSNMTPDRFERAQTISRNKIVYNQVHYNVQYREIEKYGLLEHAKLHDYFLAAWRPLQKGLLPGSKILETIAKKYNKTPTQIALQWLVSTRKCGYSFKDFCS